MLKQAATCIGYEHATAAGYSVYKVWQHEMVQAGKTGGSAWGERCLELGLAYDII